MARTFLIAVGACLLTALQASCPNGCSGHGLCKDKDACRCDPNYTGADCSQRVCPFDFAFVDTPRGDLNHNGAVQQGDAGYVSVGWSNVAEYEVFPTDSSIYSAAENEAHFYAECSGKGACNRQTGQCQCTVGYTGAACQRTTCPNDCSGHGVCRTLREIAGGALNKFVTKSVGGANWFTGVQNAFDYNGWDADKKQSCVCDAGFSGYDCSQRLCPRGDDPLTTGAQSCGGNDCTWEKQSFILSEASETILRIGYTDSFNATMYAYLTVDVLNTGNGYIEPADMSELQPGPTTVAGKIQSALRSLPSGLLKRVEVYPLDSAEPVADADSRTFIVTFIGAPGDQFPLTVEAISGPGGLAAGTEVAEVVKGNYEGIECAGRGICDTQSGLCKCFSGYTGEACSIQNALPM